MTSAKFRLGLPMISSAGHCPACLAPSGTICWGTGGERISRHNQMRNAIYNTAVEAGLAPIREGRALLPDTARWPADILIPALTGGRNAALDVTVTHPLQVAARASASITPGHTMVITYEKKVRDAEELCRRDNFAFIPVVAESLGGLHPVAVEQLRRLERALSVTDRR